MGAVRPVLQSRVMADPTLPVDAKDRLAQLLNRPTKTRTVRFAFQPDDADRHAELVAEAERLKAEADKEARLAQWADDGTPKPERERLVKEARLAADAARTEADDFLDTVPSYRWHLEAIGAAARERLEALATDDTGTVTDERLAPLLVAACTTSIEMPDGSTLADLSAEDFVTLRESGAWAMADLAIVVTAAHLLDYAAGALPIEAMGKGYAATSG